MGINYESLTMTQRLKEIFRITTLSSFQMVVSQNWTKPYDIDNLFDHYHIWLLECKEACSY